MADSHVSGPFFSANGFVNGNVTILGSTIGPNWTLTLPPTAGANGQVLQTDGSGNTSWVAGGGGGGTPGGSNRQLQFNNANTFGGATFEYDPGSGGLYSAFAAGGSQGLGTVNATGFYVNGVQLTGGGVNPGGDYGTFQINGTTGGVQTAIILFGSDNGLWTPSTSYTGVATIPNLGYGFGCTVDLTTDASGPIDTYGSPVDNNQWIGGTSGTGTALIGGSGTGAGADWVGPGLLDPSPGPLTSFTISNPGNGYLVGDVVYIDVGGATYTVTVTSVLPGGKVATYSINTPGSGYVLPEQLTINEPGGGSGQVTLLIISLSNPVYAMYGMGNYDFVGNSVVVAGTGDTAGNYDFIGAGIGNSTVDAGGFGNFIGSGFYNSVDSQFYSAIAGGQLNTISTASYSFIGGGASNSVTDSYSSVVGGSGNIVSGEYSSVVGGSGASVTGDYSSVLNGVVNSVTGNYSVAMGRYAIASSDNALTIGANNSFGAFTAEPGGSQSSELVLSARVLGVLSPYTIAVPAPAGFVGSVELTYLGTGSSANDSYLGGKDIAVINYGVSGVSTAAGSYSYSNGSGAGWTVTIDPNGGNTGFDITVTTGPLMDTNWVFRLIWNQVAPSLT